MNIDKELNRALLSNLRYKSRIVAVFAAAILVLQVVMMNVLYFTTDLFARGAIKSTVLLGPFLLLGALLLELYAVRYFNRLLAANLEVSNRFKYLITFVEVSYPALILGFIGTFALGTGFFTLVQLLNSPPSFFFFLMILLSSLMLDFRLSCFAGVVAGVEYSLLTLFFFYHQGAGNFGDMLNNFFKSVLLVVSGVIAGFISKKIKEAVLSSLQSKDDLINRLDQLVREKTSEIMAQKEEIMEKNKDITDSINYARRIQTAILPRPELFDAMFEDYFVLYRPKDVVSGDFYWGSRQGKKNIIAACDCTGHGVPGAFMSMVGSSLLNEIVNEKNTIKSADILNSLRERMVKTLQQTGAAGENKDGMDIALCSIEGYQLEFSGANNPMYLVRDGQLTEYKGDKHPIGIHLGTEHNFSSQVIELKKGDNIYIFTDGYADQFGGTKNKKFMYKKLQEKLIAIAHKLAHQQRDELERSFLDWRGKNDQVDDVLIIGIRF